MTEPSHKPIPARHRVAFLGFSDFERSTLSSFFRLAAGRTPHYDQVAVLAHAAFVVADADHATSVQLVTATERLASTVFIGAQAPVGSMAWLPRPIDALQVMRELDAMVARSQTGAPADRGGVTLGRHAGWAAPAADDDEEELDMLLSDGPPTLQSQLFDDGPVTLPSTHRWPDPATPPVFVPDASAILLEPAYARFTPAMPMPRRVADAGAVAAPVSEPVNAPANMPMTALNRQPLPEPVHAHLQPMQQPRQTTPPDPPTLDVIPSDPDADLAAQPVLPRALLVDDSDIALRFLETRLEPWGLQIDRASNSHRALDLLARHSYDLVFLDIELGDGSELGGLDLCQHIKHSASAVSAAVVLVSAHHSEMDRVRGALAGCDAYLGKPLQQGELERLLQRHGLKRSTVAV